MPGWREMVREVHRRSLWQVLGLYLAASWVVLQVVEALTNTAGLPDWVPPFALVLLLIGLPVVMATAFIAHGLKRGAPAGEVEGATPATMAASSAEVSEGEATTPALDSGDAAPTHHRLFTWRNALLGGLAAFALLGVVAGGWMAMRALGIGPAGTLVARGVLEERDRILLADFSASDSLLGRAATQAFRVDFEQSPTVVVVSPTEVARVLERMHRDPATALTPEVAREVAIREGIPAVMTGEISPAGSRYVLSARLVGSERGEVLASHRENAAGDGEVLDAIDRLSARMRERIGESLRSIRAGQPLSRVTTASLDALRKYSQALWAIEAEGDPDRGIPLLEEAVALDTGFAMAWRKLGVELANRSEQRARAVAALTKAYEHRDRLTERERYYTAGTYHHQVTRDRERAITAYESLLELEPENAGALNNLGLLHSQIEDWGRSEELLERAVAADSANSIYWSNLVVAETNLGKFDEARATLAAWRASLPEDPFVPFYEGGVAFGEGDYAATERAMEAVREAQRGSLSWRAATSGSLAALDALRGRLAEAETHTEDRIAAQEERDLAGEALTASLNPAFFDLRIRRDPEAALAAVESALERYSLEALEPADRPYLYLAGLYAEAGRPDRAREILAGFEREVPAEVRRGSEDGVHRTRGWIALAEGRHEEAIAELWRAEEGRCNRRCADLARAYDAAGRADSARVLYERWVETPAFGGGILEEALNRAAFLERLGELYEESGDPEKARLYYARFTELWAEADPELRPRVEAARARLEVLLEERG